MNDIHTQVNAELRRLAFEQDIEATLPFSNFRIFDRKEKRWRQGRPRNAEAITYRTDHLNIFGEFNLMGNILLDQDSDTALPLQRINDLVVVHDTGFKDAQGWHIYFGDILSMTDTDGVYREWVATLKGCNLVLKPYKGSTTEYPLSAACRNMLITGSILEALDDSQA